MVTKNLLLALFLAGTAEAAAGVYTNYRNNQRVNCPDLGIGDGSTLESCLAACDQKQNCNSVNFHAGTKQCSLRQCALDNFGLVQAPGGWAIYTTLTVPTREYIHYRSDQRSSCVFAGYGDGSTLDSCLYACDKKDKENIPCNSVNFEPISKTCYLRNCTAGNFGLAPLGGWHVYTTLHVPIRDYRLYASDKRTSCPLTGYGDGSSLDSCLFDCDQKLFVGGINCDAVHFEPTSKTCYFRNCSSTTNFDLVTLGGWSVYTVLRDPTPGPTTAPAPAPRVYTHYASDQRSECVFAGYGDGSTLEKCQASCDRKLFVDKVNCNSFNWEPISTACYLRDCTWGDFGLAPLGGWHVYTTLKDPATPVTRLLSAISQRTAASNLQPTN